MTSDGLMVIIYTPYKVDISRHFIVVVYINLPVVHRRALTDAPEHTPPHLAEGTGPVQPAQLELAMVRGDRVMARRSARDVSACP